MTSSTSAGVLCLSTSCFPDRILYIYIDMKRSAYSSILLLLALAWLFASQVYSEENAKGLLLLKNGDQVDAGILGIADKGFQVQFPWADTPFVIPFEEIKWFAQPETSPKLTSPQVVLSLPGGDQLSGTQLTKSAEQGWRFQTSWGQEMTLTPDALQRIRFYAPGRLKMWGPTTGSEWGSHSLRRSQNRNQRLSRPALAGRVVLNSRQPSMLAPTTVLPDPFLLEIAYAFETEPTNSRFTLFQNSGRLRSGQLNIGLTTERLTANWFEFQGNNTNKRKGRNWNEKIKFVPGPQVLQVVGGSKDATIRLNMKNTLQKDFKFPALKQEEFYDNFQFQISQSHISSLIVSNVRLVKWDSETAPPMGLPPEGKTRLVTYDGKVEFGEVLSLSPTALEWKQEGGTSSLSVPLEKVFELSITTGEPSEVKTQQDVSLVYTGIAGDRFRFKLTKVEAGFLVGKSPSMVDPLQIPMDGVQFWRMDGTKAGEAR